MSLPIVSIIVPNYNCESYIGRAIDSVLDQTFTNFELIIVDDGSTDNSREIITNYSKRDNRIKPIFLDRNEGICNALNIGLSNAKGKYYARIDSDDCWNSDKLEKQYNYMENNLEVGICFTWVTVVDEEGTPLTKEQTDRIEIFDTQNKSRGEWLEHFFFRGSCLCHPSAFFRAEVIKTVGEYNYSLRQVQDYELWIRIAKAYNIHVITEPLMKYTWFMKGGKNISAPSAKVMNRSRTEFLYCFDTFFDNMPDEVFIQGFSKYFLNKNSRTSDELLCEKAFLLLQTTFVGNDNKIVAIPKFIKLFQEDTTRKLLNERYGFTLQTFYEITAYKLYMENPYGSINSEESECLKVENEVSLKLLIKKVLKKYPKIFNVAKKINDKFNGR